MRVVQTTEQTAKQASEWVEELREWAATPGAARVDPGDCDELATLIERLAEWKPKPVPCDVGRYPCVHEERMPTYNCDRCPRSESDECAHCHFTRAKHEVLARAEEAEARVAELQAQQAKGAEPVAWMSRSRFQHDHGVATIVDGAERPTAGSAKWSPVYAAPVSQREPDARLKAQRDRAVALLRTMQIPWFYETAPHDDCVALNVLLAEIDDEVAK